MYRILVLATALAATALGGCIGALQEENANTIEQSSLVAPEVPPVAIPAALGFKGCVEQFAAFPVPAEGIADMLPPGFAPMPFDPAGQAAMILTIAYTCNEAAAEGDDEAKTASEMWGLLPVTVPREYQGSTEFHTVVLGGFTTSERLAEVYNAWGIDTLSVGEVTYEILRTPASETGFSHGQDDAFRVDITTTVAGPATKMPGSSARAFIVSEQTVTGYYEMTWNEANAIENGEALFESMPGFVPVLNYDAAPGIASHFWGDDYGYELVFTSLVDAEDADA